MLRINEAAHISVMYSDFRKSKCVCILIWSFNVSIFVQILLKFVYGHVSSPLP